MFLSLHSKARIYSNTKIWVGVKWIICIIIGGVCGYRGLYIKVIVYTHPLCAVITISDCLRSKVIIILASSTSPFSHTYIHEKLTKCRADSRGRGRSLLYTGQCMCSWWNTAAFRWKHRETWRHMWRLYRSTLRGPEWTPSAPGRSERSRSLYTADWKGLL